MFCFSKKNLIKLSLVLLMALGFLVEVRAEEEKNSSTELGVYFFAADIEGRTTFGTINTDIDVSFSDIWDNLDMAFMAFAENKHNRWSYILDFAYLDVSADRSRSIQDLLQVNLDVGLTQTILQAFAGYSVYQGRYENTGLDVDLLGGLRYNELKMDLGVQGSIFDLPFGGQRSKKTRWTDLVFAARLNYYVKRHTFMLWADYGLFKVGADTSWQIIGLYKYTFKNGLGLFGGYRHYAFDYDEYSGGTRFRFNLDYSGPMAGISYKF